MLENQYSKTSGLYLNNFFSTENKNELRLKLHRGEFEFVKNRLAAEGITSETDIQTVLVELVSANPTLTGSIINTPEKINSFRMRLAKTVAYTVRRITTGSPATTGTQERLEIKFYNQRLLQIFFEIEPQTENE